MPDRPAIRTSIPGPWGPFLIAASDLGVVAVAWGTTEVAFETALAEDELITEIRLPGPRDDAGSAFVSLSQRASGYSIVGVAVVVIKEGGSAITSAGIALTGVGDAPYRARAVEAALVGNEGTPESIADAAAHATDGVTVSGDIHADTEYRTAMAVTYTRRAIVAALGRLG